MPRSRCQSCYAYYLQFSDESAQVCKPFFVSTSGVPERTIMSWIKDNEETDSIHYSTSDGLSEDKTPGNCGPKIRKYANITDKENEVLKEWLNDLLTLDSLLQEYTNKREKKLLYHGTTTE